MCFKRGLTLCAFSFVLALVFVSKVLNSSGGLVIRVTTTDDVGTATTCTLRQAIQALNTQSTVGACTYSMATPVEILLPAGEYSLNPSIAEEEDANASGDLDITQPVRIIGSSPSTTVIRSSNCRFFDIHVGVSGATTDVTIENINLINGSDSSGGAIRDRGNGDLTLSNVTFENNVSLATGGAVYKAEHVLSIHRSIFRSNSASEGGAVYLGEGGQLTVRSTYFEGNIARTSGGAVYLNDASLLMISSLVAGNNANRNGAGVYAQNPNRTAIKTALITNSTFSDNQAYESGGGIYVSNTNLSLVSSTLTLNMADKDTDNNGDAGGVFALGGVTNFKNSILSGNTDATPSDGGNIYPNCRKTAISGAVENILVTGKNIIKEMAGCQVDHREAVISLDPILGALTLSGGLTPTHAITSESPAYNGVPEGACTEGRSATDTTPLGDDQRGVLRPQPVGGRCDIGAFELEVEAGSGGAGTGGNGTGGSGGDIQVATGGSGGSGGTGSSGPAGGVSGISGTGGVSAETGGSGGGRQEDQGVGADSGGGCSCHVAAQKKE